MKHYLRLLPPVHELQKHPRFSFILEAYDIDENRITIFIQRAIDQIRSLILNSQWQTNEPDENTFTEMIFDKVEIEVETFSKYYLEKLINGTGTILHTNLGRARLSKRAVEHVVNVSQNYSNLEYNIKEGKRGSRHDIIEGFMKEVTGAEAAMVVNNNAAAVYLILRALASNKEVIVSRGQLVEIGGSFRVSAIMEESGAILKEVGTTNKTHLYDYENAIHEETAMIMKVHTSNFKTIGFTDSVDTKELVQLSKEQENMIFYEDLGSGVLYDFMKFGIGEEPVVKQVLSEGADIVSFSGDKLLGGPQAGIIAGKKSLIDKLKKHQLARVLRVDKMTFAALEATLKSYLIGEEGVREIPVVRDLLQSIEDIRRKAERFIHMVRAEAKHFTFSLNESTSQVGGGTMPEVELPTYVAEVDHRNLTSEQLSKNLRQSEPGIVTRMKDNKVVIDFRTIAEDEMDFLIQAFINLD